MKNPVSHGVKIAKFELIERMNLFSKKYLSEDELKSLSAVIAEAEKTTSGEIRVALRHRRSWKERSLSLHELALQEFRRLGMEKTHGRTGVLIMLLLSERKFQIIADEGIHKKVEDGTWDQIAGRMSAQFKAGRFADGITDAIREVGGVLSLHFPRKNDDRDELSNQIVEK